GVRGERRDTGDLGWRTQVVERYGREFSPVVAGWRGGSGLALEGECRCETGSNCAHAAALLLYLAKGRGVRVDRAFGAKLSPESRGPIGHPERKGEPSGTAPAGPALAADRAPRFRLRVPRRPAGERSAGPPASTAE